MPAFFRVSKQDFQKQAHEQKQTNKKSVNFIKW